MSLNYLVTWGTYNPNNNATYNPNDLKSFSLT